MKNNIKHYYKNVNGYFDYEFIIQEAIARSSSNAHFVEVGAYMGKSASYAGVDIINSGKNIKYDIVDHFMGSLNDPVGNGCKNVCLKNIEPVNSVVNLINLPSVKAAELYADNSLDYVFLDGDHNYEGIKADLIAWYPKLKLGALFAGHDHEVAFPGVIQAVKEFFNEKNIKYQTTGAPYTWKIIKL